MSPRIALRRLEQLVRQAGLPEAQALQAEECLSVLWKKELLGEEG